MVLLSLFATSLLISLGKTTIIPLPSTSGPCDVALHASQLNDTSRIDPYDPNHGERSIMVTTFTPTNCGKLHYTSYIPNATAMYQDEVYKPLGLPSGAFERLRFQTPTQQPPVNLHGNYPIVLFSPALSTSRLMYTLLLREIASRGFAVVSVDHPYDADIVEYSDGRVVLETLANISAEAEIDQALDVRVGDMKFLLDQLHNETIMRSLFPLAQCNPNLLSLDNVTIFGHSLGGAAAAQTMFVDNRFVGGINLDGAMWGSVVDKGLSNPFLLFGHTNHTQATEPSWATFWSNQRGWKLELELAQSEHYTFSDFPVLVDALNVSDEDRQAVQATYTGTIGGLRAQNVISSYIVAALQFYIHGDLSDLLKTPSASFTDVSFVV